MHICRRSRVVRALLVVMEYEDYPEGQPLWMSLLALLALSILTGGIVAVCLFTLWGISRILAGLGV